MKQRAQVLGGLLIVAALVGIGVYPVSRGIAVRYSPSKAKPKPKRKLSRVQKRRRLRRILLFWW